MAKISQYADGGAKQDTDEFIINRAGTNYKLLGSVISSGSGEPGEGFLVNGMIVVTVAGNNLTVAIKTLANANPSASDPVTIRIGNTIREITSALSVTKNAGTNWCNAGGSELATKEIDYFVYVGYNATDGIVVGFSRIPYGREYSDFSTTSTDERYCAISTITNAVAGDDYCVAGRFAATLSAGAGYTWSVPTYTNINLVNSPIIETRWLEWQPAYSASGAMTYTLVTTTVARYRIVGRTMYCNLRTVGTTGGTASNGVRATLPMDTLSAQAPMLAGVATDTAAVLLAGPLKFLTGAPDYVEQRKYDSSNFGLGANVSLQTGFFYEV